MAWIDILVFVVQQIGEWSSNIITNILFGVLDTAFDPLDLMMSSYLAFWN